jgi:predicted flap endonuclease-1-like 5' DNA nuclease
MQKVEEFRKYLGRKGKKNHVVDDLIKRCKAFEEFLDGRRKSGIDNASKEDMQAFLDAMKDQKTDVNNYLRAIGLYYRFASRPDLSALANSLRKQRISSAKKSFALKNFRGIDKKHVMRLEKEGIYNVDQMLERGKTPTSRQKLAEETGIPVEAILEFVKLADLSRIGGVKNIRARLYYDAGVDTVEKMAKWNPEKLRTYLTEFVNRTRFDGIAPLPKEVENTIKEAKKLPRIVEY